MIFIILIVRDSYYVKHNSVNPLYLIISEADEYIEEKSGSKYLVFDSGNENNGVLKTYNELWDGIKNEFETINSGKTSKRSSAEYDKDFMKIKFNSDAILPLNKTSTFHNMTIVIRSLFEEHCKFNAKVYLGECLYEL